jgi:hypothetical protein
VAITFLRVFAFLEVKFGASARIPCNLRTAKDIPQFIDRIDRTARNPRICRYFVPSILSRLSTAGVSIDRVIIRRFVGISSLK